MRSGGTTIIHQHEVHDDFNYLQTRWCNFNKIQFLFDTGARFSILPKKFCHLPSFRQSKCPRLLAANGTTIPTFGTANTTLMFENLPAARWSFIIADVQTPLIGSDIIKKWGLVLNLRDNNIFVMPARKTESQEYSKAEPQFSSQNKPCATTTVPQTNSIFYLNNDENLRNLLTQFNDLFAISLDGSQPIATSMDKLDVHHYIVTHAPPVTCRPRRLNFQKEEAVNKEINLMLKQGVIRPSSSPWASPIHVVPKATGGWRPCGDYRRLNLLTQKDNYPLPNIYDFTARINGASVFSRLDLLKGFWQVPMHPSDIPKTAIATTRGLYEFLRMPFGLKNAPNTFRRLMDQLVRGLPGLFVYLDDILVFGKNVEQHNKHLKQLFMKLRQYNLKLAPDKCLFAQSQLQFVGFTISSEGVRPPESRIKAITSMPCPVTYTDLHKFLGALNFYKRFLPRLSGKIADLYAIPKKPEVIDWRPHLHRQWQAARVALSNATTLAYPLQGAPTSISTDASGLGMAGVIEQFQQGAWRPLAFFSRKFTPNEARDSTFNRELMAAYNTVRYFRHLIEGKGCALIVDHAPLRGALQKNSDALTDKQRRYLSYLAEMVDNIYPISGKQNIVADALSRLPASINAISANGLDLDTIATHQQADPNILCLQPPKYQFIFIDNVKLMCDVTTVQPRICIPPAAQRLILDFYHRQSHPGIRQTRKLISNNCTWPNMASMIRDYVKGCVNCQKAKVFRHNRPPMQDFILPNARFSHVHLDFVGPLPESGNNNKYI